MIQNEYIYITHTYTHSLSLPIPISFLLSLLLFSLSKLKSREVSELASKCNFPCHTVKQTGAGTVFFWFSWTDVAFMYIYKYVTSLVGLIPLLLKHFNISCKANLAVMDSSFCFSGKLLLSPSILNVCIKNKPTWILQTISSSQGQLMNNCNYSVCNINSLCHIHRFLWLEKASLGSS